MESHKGFIFQPSDELILDFLKNKRLDPQFSDPHIKDIGHICNDEPWDLATESKTESEDHVRHYFCHKPDYTYKGARRRTDAGNWQITSKDSPIEARNGLTGTKKFLTFYRRSPGSKAEAKTDWVMHEYHVNDDPSYKTEYVLCCIRRKQNKKRKRGISTTDEGVSSEQLVSPPTDHSISNGYLNEENTHNIPHPKRKNHNSVSYPGNLSVQNTIYPQSITNDSPTQLSLSKHLISKRNHYGENIPTNQPLLQNNSEETTLTYPQQLPNHNWISYPENRIEQNMYSFTYPWVIPNYSPIQQLPFDHLSFARNFGGENIPMNLQPQPNDNLISHFGSQIGINCLTNALLPPYANLESQLPPHHPSVTHNFAENNSQEERLPIGESKSYGGYNRLNDASFSAVQAPISQEQELKYSNSSFEIFSDRQISSNEQVNYTINSPRSFQDENSSEETVQTFTPDFNPSKSDGEASAYAEDSSDTNTADNYAWVKELLLKKDECLLIREFKSYGGYNRLNDASFSAVQTPISQEQELKYSNSSLDNCDFSDRQISSDEQVNFMINSPWAFQDEISREETGQTLTPDFNLSKSDGEALAYAEYSSDTNIACNDAWIKEKLENFA